MSEYYTKNELYGEKFYQIPKVLFTNPLYNKGLNDREKIAFGLLKDRFSVSKKNEWFDSEGRIYFIFSQENLMLIFDCSKQTASNIKKALVKVGLLEIKKWGQGRADWLYLKKPVVTDGDIYLIEKEEKGENLEAKPVGALVTSKNKTSKSLKNRRLEVQNIDGSNTKVSKTDLSKTDLKDSLIDSQLNNLPNILKNDDDEKGPFEINEFAFREFYQYFIENHPTQFDNTMFVMIYEQMIKQELEFILPHEGLMQARKMETWGREKIRSYPAYFVKGIILNRTSKQNAKDKKALIDYQNKLDAEKKKEKEENKKPLPFYNWLEN